MSPRGPWDWDWRDAPPKRPPPKHGIKINKAGATWWGKRWIEALEHMSSGYSSRLARGKTYARAGRVHDLAAAPGKVAAKVTGSREPYDVLIELAALHEAVWSQAIAAMAAKAQFAVELLAGRMPEEIDEAFRQAGTSLFPAKPADLRTACSCPDSANPCKHVAAVHFVLAEAFDRDPFLLFELRGRSKAQVLETLRAARACDAELATEAAAAKTRMPRQKARSSKRKLPAAEGKSASPANALSAAGKVFSPADGEVAMVPMGRLRPADYDAPAEALPSLHFSFDAPPVTGALLRQLGAPPGWNGAAPAERLGPIVRAAAEAARRLALGNALSDDAAEPAVGSTAAVPKR
jgi:uncharacterized Zn finger protein